MPSQFTQHPQYSKSSLSTILLLENVRRSDKKSFPGEKQISYAKPSGPLDDSIVRAQECIHNARAAPSHYFRSEITRPGEKMTQPAHTR